MASSSSSSASSVNFVWLPSMKVWAYRPRLSVPPVPLEPTVPATSRSPDDPPIRRLEEAISERSCPICLGRVEERTEAVLPECFHAFCVECIRRWSGFRRSCPLCNREFDRWFRDIRVSERSYEVERIAPLMEKKTVSLVRNESNERESRRCLYDAWVLQTAQRTRTRLLNEARARLHAVNQRSRPLPRRRIFERTRNMLPSERLRCDEGELVRERVVRWRASIYKRKLRATPTTIHSKRCLKPSTSRNVDVLAERAQRHIEPWIERELKAVLGDSNPSVLVHFITSLWLSVAKEQDTAARKLMEGACIEKIKPFFHEHSTSFWHELRCFAESSLTISAYDSVVEYRRY